MDYCLSKNGLKKIINNKLDGKDGLLVQIIDIKNIDDETSKVILWDGRNKKKVAFTQQAQKKIKEITNWSIVEILEFHVVDIKSSENEESGKKNKAIVIEEIHLKHNGYKIRKKIIYKYNFNIEGCQDNEQCEIENSSDDDIVSFSGESEQDFEEEKNDVELSDSYKHENKNKQQEIGYEMHNILPNDSDEEMSCFDSDEKEKLKNIYTKLLKKDKKNVMYGQNKQLSKDYKNPVKINKSQLIAEKQIENDCKEFKEKDLMDEFNEEMFEDHEDVLTHENEQQLINYHEEMIENYEEEQMENNCKELKEKDKEKMIENDGEVIKENSGEKMKENDGKKMIENDGKVIKENSGEKMKENDGKKMIENDGEVIKENSGEKMKENDGKKMIENDGEVIKENSGEKMKENDGKKMIENDGEVIKENSGEKMKENDGKKMIENDDEKMDDFDEFMSDSLVEPEDYENIISQANDKETKKDNKNDDENDKNKEVITVSKEPIDVKDINLTKLSELTIILQSSKIIVKVHSVYPCTRTNFFFIVQGNEKSPIMLCVAYPFIGNKLRNKIKPGTFIEITNACVKYIDSQHSILCDDSTFELVLNEFYKTKINILSVISNNINDLPSSSGILPEQSQSNLKVKPNKLFRKNSQPTVKPFIIKNNNNIKFTPFTTFAKQNYTKYEKINVIGRVLSYTTCSKIWTKDNEQTIRHVKLVDMSNNQLDASLWNKKAETFSPPLGSLVQIQKAGVRKYQGKNNLSVYDCSDIKVCKEDE